MVTCAETPQFRASLSPSKASSKDHGDQKGQRTKAKTKANWDLRDDTYLGGGGQQHWDHGRRPGYNMSRAEKKEMTQNLLLLLLLLLLLTKKVRATNSDSTVIRSNS